MISIGRISRFLLLSRLSARNAWTDEVSFDSRSSRSMLVKWSRASTYWPWRYKATPRSNRLHSGLSVSRSNRGPGSGKTPRTSSGGSGSVVGRSCRGVDCPSAAPAEAKPTDTTPLSASANSAANHDRRCVKDGRCTEGGNQQVSCPSAIGSNRAITPQIGALGMPTNGWCQKLQQASKDAGQEFDMLRSGCGLG